MSDKEENSRKDSVKSGKDLARNVAKTPHYGSRSLPLRRPDSGKQLACLIHEVARHALFLMFNASADAVEFALPPAPPAARWYLAVNTARETALDLLAPGVKRRCDESQTHRLSPRFSAILLAR